MFDKISMFVSSWAEHGGKPGLNSYFFDQNTGEITFGKSLNTEDSFNCACVDARRCKMYLNNEVWYLRSEKACSGRIFVYDLDAEKGAANEAAHILTGCPCPAYLTLDPTGQYLFVAHHSYPVNILKHMRRPDGTWEKKRIPAEADLQVYALDDQGNVGQLVENIDQTEVVQGEECHPHSAVFSPSGNLIAVTDKGSGELFLYHFNYETRRLELKNRILADTEGACAPRYAIFHPNKNLLYINYEKSYDGNCYISVFSYSEDGNLKAVQKINALKEGTGIKTYTRLEQQGFQMSRGGETLYTLVSAADIISVLKIDKQSGLLTLVQNIPVRGVRPRGLTLSPNGKFLLTTCLVSGDIAVYKIGKDGRLKETENHANQLGASAITFYVPEETGGQKK